MGTSWLLSTTKSDNFQKQVTRKVSLRQRGESEPFLLQQRDELRIKQYIDLEKQSSKKNSPDAEMMPMLRLRKYLRVHDLAQSVF